MNAGKCSFPAGSHLCRHCMHSPGSFLPSSPEAGKCDGQTYAGFTALGPGTRHEISPLCEPGLPGGWQSHHGQGAPKGGIFSLGTGCPHWVLSHTSQWAPLQQLPKRPLETRVPQISAQGKSGFVPLCHFRGPHSGWRREAVWALYL